MDALARPAPAPVRARPTDAPARPTGGARRRVAPRTASVLVAVVCGLLAPPAASATDLKLGEFGISDLSSDGGTLSLPLGTINVTIGYHASKPCQSFIVQPEGGPPVSGAGQPTVQTPEDAHFELTLVGAESNAGVTLTFHGEAVCGLLDLPTSPPTQMTVPRAPAPPASLDDYVQVMQAMIGLAEAEKKEIRKGIAAWWSSTIGSTDRTGPRASSAAGAAAVFLPYLAREARASHALFHVVSIGSSTGDPAQHVAPAAALPVPALPAALAGARRADVAALFTNLADQIRLGEALGEALARGRTALEQGDAAAGRLQTRDAAVLAEQLAGALGDAEAVRGRAQAALAATFALPPATLTQPAADAIVATALTGGLAPGITAALTGAGASPTLRLDTARLMRALTPADADGATASVALPDQGLETAAAGALRTAAAELRQGSQSVLAPIAGRRVAHGTGELRQLTCLAAAVRGCRPARAIAGAKWIAPSPDGRFVYVSSQADTGSIAVFRRDPARGTLTQLAGRAGCYAAGISGCTAIAALSGLQQIVISPDGRSLYGAAADTSTVVALARDPRSGGLRSLGCVGAASGCAPAPDSVLAGVKTLAVSPDGRDVYAASPDGGALVELARDRRTGALRYLGCVSSTTSGCDPARAITAASGVAVSRDGRYVYEADTGSWAVTALRRDARTGRLVEAGCVAGRDGTTTTDGCAAGLGIAGPEWVTASPDGSVWVGASGASAVVRLKQDLRNGALGMADVAGACTVDQRVGASGGWYTLCSGQPGLGSAYGIALSPDGTIGYAAGYAPGAVSAFSVDRRTGALVGVGPCFGAAVGGCRASPQLAHAGFVALSTDGRQLLAVAPVSGALTVYERRLAPEPVRARLARLRGRTLRTTIACPATAQSACVGTYRLDLVRRGRVRAQLARGRVVLLPGVTRVVRRRVAAAALAGGLRRLRVRVTAIASEPFGARVARKTTTRVSRMRSQ